MKKSTKKVDIEYDPVCGMPVDYRKIALVVSHQDENFYFCSEACRDAFDKNPKKFFRPKKKGIWGRYLDRLYKTTEGKPMCCH